jgi:aminopeptidase N
VGPTYQSAESIMAVPLPQPLAPGEQVVIGMDFTISVPSSQERNYGIFASVDGIMALAHFYPMIAVYDANGWDVEVPDSKGDVVYADTSFYLVRVTAPAGQVIAASGVQLAAESEADQQTLTFAAGPMRDFYLASSANYTVTSQKFGDTMVNSYFLPDRQAQGETTLKYAVDSLKSFNARYGTYPFTELDVVPTANQALGIEYPGIVAINLMLYNPDARFGNTPAQVYLEATIAHEVAHQWFYSLIGNDQLAEPWVDESLTQYATWRYYLDTQGEAGAQGFRQSLVSRMDQAEKPDTPIGQPVSQFDAAGYSAFVYGRGPLFFEALAEAVGQETLDAALQDYATNFRWGLATGDDIKHTIESHCRCDLTDLFTEWVYGP